MTDPFKPFEEGRTYYAEYEITCRYKGIVSVCGSDTIPAKCIRRTKCYATFEIETSVGILTKRGKIMRYEDQEGVYLTDNYAEDAHGIRHGIKDLSITSFNSYLA